MVFIFGIVLLGMGIFSEVWGTSLWTQTTQNVGYLFMLLGAVFGFIAMGMKYHWERVAREELEDFRHQMDIVRQQLKRSKTERDEIERQIPDSLGQWDLELQDAEQRLQRLEDLVPLESRVQNSRMHMEELRRRISAQEHEVEQADVQWRAALRTAGLPELLEPLQLKEITQRSSRISGYHTRLEQYKSELIEREKELTQLTTRIDTIFHDVGLRFGKDKDVGVHDRLARLTRELNEQRALITNRKELAGRYHSLRSKMNRAKRELEKMLGVRRKLLARVGAEDENEFRTFHTKHEQRQDLVEKRRSLTEQISVALGNNFEEHDISEYLDAYNQLGLEKKWEAIQADIEELKERQTRLHQQRGELLQEVKALGEDSRMDEVRLELNAVDVEIKELKKQWQVLGSSMRMLESIRETFESKRQPETLREASEYLDSLTEGHYTRIWTRLVGEELLVDNHAGETITVDTLSRGTREAVYLSLRMALVTAYARRGAVLPLVLDDVLVNFDARRARSAAKLLCEFARNGYQILMFTCHDHMRDMFYDLDADVRILPYHKDVVESGAAVMEYRGVGYVAPVQPVVQEYVPAPVEVIAAPVAVAAPAVSIVELNPDEYDPDLEYELSAIESDQQEEQRLRHELVYVSPNQHLPIDLSGEDDFWFESNSSIGN
ncbi:MAG: hypothetical protein AAF456_10680 [Planctomycetota bacterium]